MNHDLIIERLSHNVSIVKSIVQNVTAEQARWKPSQTEWSILEIVNHMIDEEKDDFRTRLRLALEEPHATWPPIDPEAWAAERDYNERDFKASLSNWLDEREQSVAWLKNLDHPDWKSTSLHPKLGPMSAELVLANWLAHDLLHIRQMVSVLWANLAFEVDPISLDYAGNL
jgi:hypothetical protein